MTEEEGQGMDDYELYADIGNDLGDILQAQTRVGMQGALTWLQEADEDPDALLERPTQFVGTETTRQETQQTAGQMFAQFLYQDQKSKQPRFILTRYKSGPATYSFQLTSQRMSFSGLSPSLVCHILPQEGTRHPISVVAFQPGWVQRDLADQVDHALSLGSHIGILPIRREEGK